MSGRQSPGHPACSILAGGCAELSPCDIYINNIVSTGLSVRSTLVGGHYGSVVYLDIFKYLDISDLRISLCRLFKGNRSTQVYEALLTCSLANEQQRIFTALTFYGWDLFWDIYLGYFFSLFRIWLKSYICLPD